MMTSVVADAENPDIYSPTSSSSWFSHFDPAFPTTVISMATNFILSNMFVYGITGNARLA